MTHSLLSQVIATTEASRLYGLSSNALGEAIRRGALPARKSGDRYLICIHDLVVYQRGRIPYLEWIPPELLPAFQQARRFVFGSPAFYPPDVAQESER